MSIDLSGGLDASRDYVFANRPDEPEMRDAVNMWVSDDRGVLGLPRFAAGSAPSSCSMVGCFASASGSTRRKSGWVPAANHRQPSQRPHFFCSFGSSS